MVGIISEWALRPISKDTAGQKCFNVRREKMRQKMPFHTLKPFKPGQGTHPGYHVVGNFQNMLYLAPDIRGDKLKVGSKNAYESKTDEEVTAEFRCQLEGLYELTGVLMDDAIIKDYWLVITPAVCDHAPEPFKAPLKSNNFLVTPMNIEELDLIEKLIVPSGMACGEAQPRPDPRRRLANQAELGVYVAVEINDQHASFNESAGQKPGDEGYDRALLTLSLSVGDAASRYMEAPVRMFLQNGKTADGPRFVEQHMDATAKTKTHGFKLGEGYIRGLMRGLDASKIHKHIVFSDMFASSGVKFTDFGLSKEELESFKSEFKTKPWIPIEYKR
jgi:hypothetical protein